MPGVRRAALLAATHLGACGRIGFDPTAVALDGSTEIDAITSAFTPFSPPTDLPFDSSGGIDDPSLTDDELQMVVTAQIAGASCEVAIATRNDVASAFSTRTPIPELTSPQCDATASLSGDGLSMVLARIVDGSFDILETSRANRVSPWETPALIAELRTGASELGPSVSADGLVMVFYRDDALVEATRASTNEPWVARTISELAVARERSPHLSSDALTMFFTSDRAGGLGGFDLYFASRASRTEPFGPASHVPELSSADEEDDPWLSPDLTHIVFVRRLPNTTTVLREARRTRQ